MSSRAGRSGTIITIGAVLGVVVLIAPSKPAGANVNPPYSRYGAGYQVFSSTVPPTTATTQFQVPTVTCSRQSSTVGLGTTIISNGGPHFAQSWVEIGCTKKGIPIYRGLIVL